MKSARLVVQELRESADSGALDELCERLGVELLGVFGSAVDTGAVEPHDVDVAVRFRRSGLTRTLELIDALTILTDYERFDVLDLASAGTVARKEAMFGVGLYEDVAGRWALEQMAAHAEWRDTKWLRDLAIEAMSR